MKKYKSNKRNKTKRRTHNNRINKRRKTQKKNNKRKKTNIKGGDGGKPKPYPTPVPIPDPIPIPIPPRPSPKPTPNRSLNLISKFKNIKPNTLYFLQAGDDLLYIFTDEGEKDMMNREIWESIISDINEFPEVSNDCERKLCEDILPYFKKDKYEFQFPIKCYRIAPTDYPNYLCLASNKWETGPSELFEVFFEYINSIYNIYEIDEWPKFLPPLPIKKSNKIPLLEECSEEYIKQNKNKMECNQSCCGWPQSGYVCGEVDGLLVSEGACVQEKKTQVLKNPTY